MKTTFTLIALFFVSFAYSAERWSPASGSQLQLRIDAQGDYEIEIGNQQHQFFQGVLRLNYLPPGRHFVQVTESVYGRWGQLTGRRVIYRGAVNVPARSRVFARLIAPGRLVVDRIVPVGPAPQRRAPNQYGRAWQNDNWDDWDDRRGRAQWQGYYDYDEHRNPPNGRPGQRGGFNAPTHNQGNFQLFMQGIRNESFDKNRLNLGREYLRYNDLSSRQVIEVMNALSFESSRLEFAKEAYSRVIDPQNYFLVMNALTFSSSKNELQRYISGR